MKLTPELQRGFCKGRQLSMNIVDLDAYMRAFNDLYEPPGVVDSSNVGQYPATALYDFCNAFPTLLHAWLFLLLKVLKLPDSIRWTIWWFYQKVTAFSSGTGDGSFLFCVQAGVKTGCPLSSLLFLLGVNPVIDLFLRLSDGPKLSATRVCVLMTLGLLCGI